MSATSAAIIQLADAVLAQIQAADLPLQFTGSRTYQFERKKEECGQLLVDVLPRQIKTQLAARVFEEGDYGVSIVVSQQCNIADTATLDGLLQFVEAVRLLLAAIRRPPAMPIAALMGIDMPAVLFPDRLRNEGLFRALVVATYRIYDSAVLGARAGQ
jgi:hypothetical protein